ncbi:hypothetical protein CLHUN_01640 [Ruminiclostridium hungatei]|uniref:Uncharacterized protein n=1 Tax=Ruminiclostridium hungatei TaxID=48256 RepID=A0A1V4SR29_RUMHU|nr:hypothetical protein [Ruminiclostridium hungatei]OPX46348.1 hypothetical protein CLHUN_01640 [Ruminiclostridium hungatei]
MSEVKIIRNDRGVDFRRIEKFLELFQERCRKKAQVFTQQESELKKKRETEAFAYFGIDSEIEEIKRIDAEIKKFKELRSQHEEKVRDYTQGKDKEKRYNSYDSIREGSPIQVFIDVGIADVSKNKDEIWALNQQLSNELWYARNLEQAIEIMQAFQSKLDSISLDGDGNA